MSTREKPTAALTLGVKRFGALAAFDEAAHPRDRRGRFIELGAEVEILGGARATVVGVGKVNGRISVRLAEGGAIVERHRNYLTVISGPPKGTPAAPATAPATAPAAPAPKAPAPVAAPPAPPAPSPASSTTSGPPAPPVAAPPPRVGAVARSDRPNREAASRPLPDAEQLDALADPRHTAAAFTRYGQAFLDGLGSRDDSLGHTDPEHRERPLHQVTADDARAAKAATVRELTRRMETVPDAVLFGGRTPVFTAGDFWTRDPVTGRLEQFVPLDDGWEPEPERVGPGRTYVRSEDPWLRAEVRYERVNEAVSTWASTSNDSNAAALAIQEVARTEFGLDGAADWDGIFDPERVRREIDQDLARHREFYAAFLHAQYEATQDWLAAHGITELEVHRGFKWEDLGEVPAWARGAADNDVADVTLRPISSFTVDAKIAGEFAGSVKANPMPKAVISGVIPADRVLSIPRSGVGCLNEWEVVTLAGPGQWTVRTHAMPMTDAELAAADPASLDRYELRRAIALNPTDPARRAALTAAADREYLAVPEAWKPPREEDAGRYDPYGDRPVEPDEIDAAAAVEVEAISTARQLYAALAAELAVPTTGERQAALLRVAAGDDVEIVALEIPVLAAHWGVTL